MVLDGPLAGLVARGEGHHRPVGIRRQRGVQDRAARGPGRATVRAQLVAQQLTLGLVLAEGRQALDASAELDRLEALPERSLHRTEHARAAEDVRDRARELDRLDDAVAAANTFLNRHPGWPAAWDQQTAPLRADLDAVGTLASSVGSAGPVRSAVAALESLKGAAALCRS